VAREDRWQHLVTGAFQIDDELAVAPVPNTLARRRLLARYLDSVLEVFPADLDPVEDFEGYAVRRLAQSIRRALGLVPPPRGRRQRAGDSPRSTAPSASGAKRIPTKKGPNSANRELAGSKRIS
jgi:hypothetical protein